MNKTEQMQAKVQAEAIKAALIRQQFNQKRSAAELMPELDTYPKHYSSMDYFTGQDIKSFPKLAYYVEHSRGKIEAVRVDGSREVWPEHSHDIVYGAGTITKEEALSRITAKQGANPMRIIKHLAKIVQDTAHDHGWALTVLAIVILPLIGLGIAFALTVEKIGDVITSILDSWKERAAK